MRFGKELIKHLLDYVVFDNVGLCDVLFLKSVKVVEVQFGEQMLEEVAFRAELFGAVVNGTSKGSGIGL
jgi:hypothetical protein